jgi:hypothetical protein
MINYQKMKFMKMKKISILFLLCLGLVSFLPGCSKDDGAVPNRVDIEDVPVVSMPLDASSSTNISFANQASFSGKFRAEMYFPGEKPPTKIDIVVRKFNGSTANNNNIRVWKTDVSSLPTTFTVTVADIVALFGAPVALGDRYDFAPDIYVGTKKYEAFPPVGTGTGAGVISMPFYKEYARFIVQ